MLPWRRVALDCVSGDRRSLSPSHHSSNVHDYHTVSSLVLSTHYLRAGRASGRFHHRYSVWCSASSGRGISFHSCNREVTFNFCLPANFPTGSFCCGEEIIMCWLFHLIPGTTHAVILIVLQNIWILHGQNTWSPPINSFHQKVWSVAFSNHDQSDEAVGGRGCVDLGSREDVQEQKTLTSENPLWAIKAFHFKFETSIFTMFVIMILFKVFQLGFVPRGNVQTT